MALAITRTLKANNKTVYVSLLSILDFSRFDLTD